MKRLMTAMVLGVSLMGSAATFAGPYSHHGEEGGNARMHFLEKKLDLTEEQKVAIRQIHEQHQTTREKPHNRKFMHAIAQLDPGAADYQQQVAAIAKEQAAQVEQSIIARANVHAQVYEVLTPEQREKMKVLKEKRMQKKAEKE